MFIKKIRLCLNRPSGSRVSFIVGRVGHTLNCTVSKSNSSLIGTLQLFAGE